MNALKKKYSEIVEQCKQAETIIILNADLVLTRKTLSNEDKKRLARIKSQVWRIDRLLVDLPRGETFAP